MEPFWLVGFSGIIDVLAEDGLRKVNPSAKSNKKCVQQVQKVHTQHRNCNQKGGWQQVVIMNGDRHSTACPGEHRI